MKTWIYVLPESATDADYENQSCEDDGKYVVFKDGLAVAEFETLEEVEEYIKQ